MTDLSPSPSAERTLYGGQTTLALQNFPAHGRRLCDVPELLRSYAWVKAATADANVELGVLDPERGAAIVAAATEVAAGLHAEQFRLPLVQGGGGTSTNMNLNEVLAARATELLADRGNAGRVHPNDHVNRSQSTNDSYPTAMALTVAQLAQPALDALDALAGSFERKAAERSDRLRLGRTCLQDAVPLTVGQTHGGHAHVLRRTAAALAAAVTEMLAVPLGATAVGTGLAAPDGFAEVAVEHLRARSGFAVSVAEDFFDALANLDPYSTVAGAAARVAMALGKIAADLRLLSAGSVLGGGEVALPALQAGSSIMPGKVNPVIPELVMQLGYRIRGAAATVDLGVAAGELELNVMEPVVLDALVTILADLTHAAEVFRTKCVDGLVWNDEALDHALLGSRQALVEAAVDLGYESASRQAADVNGRLSS